MPLIKVKAAFFDATGLHAKGDLVEVKTFDPVLHEFVNADHKTAQEPTSDKPATRGRKKKS